jgi:hypothetical protein
MKRCKLRFDQNCVATSFADLIALRLASGSKSLVASCLFWPRTKIKAVGRSASLTFHVKQAKQKSETRAKWERMLEGISVCGDWRSRRQAKQ